MNYKLVKKVEKIEAEDTVVLNNSVHVYLNEIDGDASTIGWAYDIETIKVDEADLLVKDFVQTHLDARINIKDINNIKPFIKRRIVKKAIGGK